MEKLINYFLGFNAGALAYTVFTQMICDMTLDTNKWIYSCLAFSVLSSTAAYNLIQGYRLHKKQL